jgi:hypothetical protein
MTSTTADGGAAYAFKIIIVGDSNVGKTSIVHRFLHAERPPHVHLTVGVDFGIRNVVVGDVRIKLQLWATWLFSAVLLDLGVPRNDLAGPQQGLEANRMCAPARHDRSRHDQHGKQ